MLDCVSPQGLESSWGRHQKVAEYFHTGLENMGLKLFVKEKVSQSVILWCVWLYFVLCVDKLSWWFKIIKKWNVWFLTAGAVSENQAAHSHHDCCSSWVRLEGDHNLHHENTQLRDFRRARTISRFGKWLCLYELIFTFYHTNITEVQMILVFSGSACGTHGM